MAGGMIVVIGGIALATIARRHSLIVMWAAFIQLVFAVYLSSMLTRPIVALFAREGADPYYYATTVLLMGMMFFLGMHVVVKQFMPGVSELRFPPVFDLVGAVVLGFSVGSLASSFLLFILCITPLGKSSLAIRISGEQGLARVALPLVQTACSVVDGLSFQSDALAGRDNAQWLLKREVKRPARAGS